MKSDSIVNYDDLSELKIVVVGSLSCSILQKATNASLKSVEVVAVADSETLTKTTAKIKIPIVNSLALNGLTEQSDDFVLSDLLKQIEKALVGAKTIILVSDMSSIGSYIAPVISDITDSLCLLSIGIIIQPFEFEDDITLARATQAINRLEATIDALIVVPSDRLMILNDSNQSLLYTNSSILVDKYLSELAELFVLNKDSYIGLEEQAFIDQLKDTGYIRIGLGKGSGKNKYLKAAKRAKQSALGNSVTRGAKKAIIKFRVSDNIHIEELEKSVAILCKDIHDDAEIIWSVYMNKEAKDYCGITVIASQHEDISSIRARQNNRQTQAIIEDADYMKLPLNKPISSIRELLDNTSQVDFNITTGYEQLDSIVHISKGHHVLITSNSNEMKTVFGINLAVGIAAKNRKVLFVTTEHSPGYLTEFFLTSALEKSSDTNDNRVRYANDIERLRNDRFYIIDARNKSAEWIKNEIVRQQAEVVIIDQLSSVKRSSSDNEQRITDITEILLLMRGYRYITVIGLQCNYVEYGKAPQANDLKQGQMLTHIMDCDMMLHQSKNPTEHQSSLSLYITNTPSGNTGIIEMEYIEDYHKIVECEENE
ncbi:MAG: hypothetical protein FWG21_01480 [Oscillospiraceae bacterium]|nr:hypothetical protein [Oscillospiraceae bacterium]